MISDKIAQLRGLRKTGLLPDEKYVGSLQTYVPTRVELEKKIPVLPNAETNWTVYAQDQKQLSTCWAFALVGAMNAELTQRLKIQTCLEGFDFAYDVEEIIPGVSKDGYTLQGTIAMAKKTRLWDKVTRKYYVPSVQFVKSMDIQTALNNDKVLFTGGLVNYTMIDKDYCWIPGKSGHAFYLCGASDVGAWGVNSWGYWGLKKTGLFKVRAMDYRRLFSCYSIKAIEV